MTTIVHLQDQTEPGDGMPTRLHAAAAAATAAATVASGLKTTNLPKEYTVGGVLKPVTYNNTQ